MVAKLKEELASADTRAQVAEWDNQELRLEVEELKEKVRGFRSVLCTLYSVHHQPFDFIAIISDKVYGRSH